jgi:hypothetical protein
MVNGRTTGRKSNVIVIFRGPRAPLSVRFGAVGETERLEKSPRSRWGACVLPRFQQRRDNCTLATGCEVALLC